MNTFIFIGRLYPKPLHFKFPYFESDISPSKNPAVSDRMKISMNDDLINIAIDTEYEYDAEELGVLKNSILYLVKGFLDAYGYCHHMAFNIDIQGVILPNKQVLHLLTVPSETESQTQHSINGKLILNLLHKSPSLNRVLVDYRNALMIPEDIGFFLYRVTEDIRRHFERKYGLDKNGAWIKMNSELNLSHDLIKLKIKPYADNNRHGDLVSITNKSGIDLFLLVRKIIDRFILYLDSGEQQLKVDELS